MFYTDKPIPFYRSDEDWFKHCWEPVLSDAFAQKRAVPWSLAVSLALPIYNHYAVYRYITDENPDIMTVPTRSLGPPGEFDAKNPAALLYRIRQNPYSERMPGGDIVQHMGAYR